MDNKNCEPALFGSAALAIETIPRLCLIVLNSASIEYPGSPVPQTSLDQNLVCFRITTLNHKIQNDSMKYCSS